MSAVRSEVDYEPDDDARLIADADEPLTPAFDQTLETGDARRDDSPVHRTEERSIVRDERGINAALLGSVEQRQAEAAFSRPRRTANQDPLFADGYGVAVDGEGTWRAHDLAAAGRLTMNRAPAE